jgi:hypothetical protein
MVLNSLQHGKIDLRWAIQNEVNSYGQEGKSPNRARARRLIKAIHELSSEIEQVEAAINRRDSRIVVPTNSAASILEAVIA